MTARRRLAPAHYEVTPEEPLVFVTGSRRWPIRIRNSAGGDLVLAFGFRAQERDDGSSLKVLERVFQEHAESLAPCTQ